MPSTDQVILKIAVYPPPMGDLPFMVVAIYQSGDVMAMQAANELEATEMAHHIGSEVHKIAEQQTDA